MHKLFFFFFFFCLAVERRKLGGGGSEGLIPQNTSVYNPMTQWLSLWLVEQRNVSSRSYLILFSKRGAGKARRSN